MSKKFFIVINYYLIFTFCLLSFSLNNSYAEQIKDKQNMEIVINQEFCKNIGASWQRFNNGCADFCSSYNRELRICTMALKWSCDCGEGLCFDQKNSACREIFRENIINIEEDK